MKRRFEMLSDEDLGLVQEAIRSYHATVKAFHDDEDTEPSEQFTHEVKRLGELVDECEAEFKARK